MAVILGLLFFGISMIVAGVGLNASGTEIGALATAFLLGGGGILSTVGTALLVIQKLYVKTKASAAFVRTGMGGLKVVMDGGSIVIPFMHETIPISLETLKVEVKREGKDALLTKDKLRADLCAEFFVKVPADAANIQAAARSFGSGMKQSGDVAKLIDEKLISALRTAAVKLSLEELNSSREEFLKEVVKELDEDLKKNGLVLESATISKLDQTPASFLAEDNVFDAQGARKIAEITEAQKTATNELKRAGELARKQRDVETKKAVLGEEQAEALAVATQATAIKTAQAEQDRLAREKEIASQRAVQIADVERQQTVEVAEQTRQQAVMVATKAQEAAAVTAQQTIEVAERAKQQAIAQAETQRTAAETDRAKAEAEREAANQAITTVQHVAAAEREKKRAVIAAEGAAETSYIEKKRTADANAYAKTAEADAEKAAAEAHATAVRTQAEAERDAQVARAAGAQAEGMVPVEVKKREVEVDRDRIETVLKPELAARETSGKIAQEFELEKLRIAAMQAIKIAMAEHSSKIFHGMHAKLFGTPEDVARAYQSFQTGNSGMEFLGGMMAALPPEAQATVKATLAGVAKKMGVEVPDTLLTTGSTVASEDTETAVAKAESGAS